MPIHPTTRLVALLTALALPLAGCDPDGVEAEEPTGAAETGEEEEQDDGEETSFRLRRTVNGAVFVAEVRKALGDVKGFSAGVVSPNSNYYASGGLADASHGMSSQSYARFGSNMKVITSLALLRVLQDQYGSVPRIMQALEQPAVNFMPDRVRQSMPSAQRQITLRDLLNHTSGLRDRAGSNSFTSMAGQPLQPSAYDYENINYRLLTALLPAIANPATLATVNRRAAAGNWRSNDDRLWNEMAAHFQPTVESRLFAHVNTSPEPVGSCYPTRDAQRYGISFARDFVDASDNSSGILHDQYPALGYCVGQGGWYFSIRSMARVYRHLGTPQGVISPTLYQAMYDRVRSLSGQYSTQSAITFGSMPSPEAAAHFGVDRLATHNGAENEPGGQGDRSVVEREQRSDVATATTKVKP